MPELHNLPLFARDDVAKFGPTMTCVEAADDTYKELVTKVMYSSSVMWLWIGSSCTPSFISNGSWDTN